MIIDKDVDVDKLINKVVNHIRVVYLLHYHDNFVTTKMTIDNIARVIVEEAKTRLYYAAKEQLDDLSIKVSSNDYAKEVINDMIFLESIKIIDSYIFKGVEK